MFEERTETHELEGCPTVTITSYYTKDGAYIGSREWADKLAEMGIEPMLRPGQGSVCSIGWCEREQKWYGWSHRAIYGFGIGSTVKKGDCAYQPTDESDFIADALRFWHNEDGWHAREWAETGEEDGVRGVHVRWIYSDTVPNEKLRGTEGGTFQRFPDEYGRGEWIAQTLEDAKQMACDFAEGVD